MESMTNETQQQTAQRLWDEGRIDPIKGKLEIRSLWHLPKSVIDRVVLFADHEVFEQSKCDLNEAYAALGVLDGSIVLD